MAELSPPKLKSSQLRLVAALAQTGKLQHAAELLGMAQPAASRALAEIEDLAGTRLFIRHPKGMTITPEGETVANKARVVLREMYDLEESLSNIRIGSAGKVRIGSVTGPAIKYLVPAIRSIKRSAPDLDVSVEVAPSRHLLRELLSGRLDFALARVLPDFDRGEFNITPVGQEKVALLVRENHPLSQKKSLKLAEIIDHEWIVQERDSPIGETLVGAFHMENLTAPKNIVNSSSLLFALGYLSGTDAIVAVSDEVVQLLIEDPIAAKFARLNLQREFVATPYFLVSLASHAESQAAKMLSRIILSSVDDL